MMDFFSYKKVQALPLRRLNANWPAIRIPLSIPYFDEAEKEALAACIESGMVSTVSPAVKKFEALFSDYLSIPHAVATQSGTAAIHLALLALGIGPGDEVIVPALSFAATVNPVRYVGAVPVFVDVEPDNFAMAPHLLEKAITPKTKAVIVSHLFGIPGAIEEIQAICRHADLPLIEDAAEALGAKASHRYTGTFGTIGCFSFNGNKTLTTGGGGIAVTHHKELAERMLHLSTQAKESASAYLSPFEISHDDIGYNYRMTGLQAAIGLAQINKLDYFLARKRDIARTYSHGISKIKGAQSVYYPEKDPIQPSYWLSVMRLPEEQAISLHHRDKLLIEARMHGIEMRPFFKPLPMLKPYQSNMNTCSQSAEETMALCNAYPNAEALWHQMICLPSSVSLTETEQQEVIRLIRQALDRKTATPPEWAVQAVTF